MKKLTKYLLIASAFATQQAQALSIEECVIHKDKAEILYNDRESGIKYNKAIEKLHDSNYKDKDFGLKMIDEVYRYHINENNIFVNNFLDKKEYVSTMFFYCLLIN